jgi:type II secretory ATPase GspE/PulE/Tfp pilus assembly ATPase PilB-like protein
MNAPNRARGSIPLTANGQVYSLPEHVQKIVCFMEDGRLFVSKTHVHDTNVTAFKALLHRTGITFEEHLVTIQVIESLYSNAATKGARDDSRNQHLAKQLFDDAVKLRASDIHIRVSELRGCQIFFRVHNDLEFQAEHPYSFGQQFCSTIYQAMADVSDSTFKPNARQDARISKRSNLPPKLDGIRVATSPQVDGYIMVLRLLYNDTNDSTSLEDLGFSHAQSRTLTLAKKRPTGINIISGPTGSGKSTTLQRILTGIIKEHAGRKHVITVEDPPEYPIPGAVQTPVTNADTEHERSIQFQLAIKSAMRLDPDVIMIGEMRDTPSVRLALQAAMTGHQVWTTLHANNALAIIDRLMDLGTALEVVTDSSIISSLSCQRLLKVLCPHCKEPLSDTMNRYKEADLKRIMSVTALDNVFVTGGGCEHCNHTGIVGRTVVAETIITDQRLMQYIRAHDRIGAIGYWLHDQEGRTMLQHSIDKINQGMTDPFSAEEVVGPLTMGMIEQDHTIQHSEISNAVDSSEGLVGSFGAPDYV